MNTQPWSRRAFLTTSASMATLGAVSGVGTALIRQAVFAMPRQGRSNPVPFPPLRGVNAVLTFTGHQHTVRAIGWSSTMAMLASGADDTQLLVWAPDGTIHQRIAHPAPVQALAWSPESQRVVSGSANQVTFIEAQTGQILARSTRHTAAVTSVQWTSHAHQQVVSGASDRQAIVWETMQYHPHAIFTGHTTSIEAVSWGADGQTVASASHGGVVRIWNAETLRELHGLYQDAQAPLFACAWSPDGTTMAAAGGNGLLRLWSNEFICQRQEQETTEGMVCLDVPQRRYTSSTQAIRALAWSPDGHYLASGSDDGSFSLWSLTQPVPLFSRTIHTGVAVRSIAWAADGKQLATASGTAVTLWRVHS